MNYTQSFILIVILVVICVAATTVRAMLTKKRRPQSNRRVALRQNLRVKVLYDEAKIDRLIEFERDELKRKGQREKTVEDLMERAIGRWERDNAGAASLY